MTFEELLKIHNSIDVSPKHGRGTVYHYTSPEGLLGIITNKYIFATDLLYLNDAAEGSYAFKLLLSVLEEDFSDRKVLYEGIKKEIDGLAKQAPNKYFTYVISFSKGEDLLNMWNYYTKGNSVEGYNVGFDITKLAHSLKIKIDKCEGIKEKDGLKVHHGAVNYDKKKQMGRIREIVHQFIDHFEDDEISTSYGEGVLYYLIVRKIYYLGLFYKAPEYKNEKEYRFVFVPGAIGKNNDWQSRGIPYKEEYRNKNGVLIPYQKCTFSSDSVVSIMCAPTNDFNRTEAKTFVCKKEIRITVPRLRHCKNQKNRAKSFCFPPGFRFISAPEPQRPGFHQPALSDLPFNYSSPSSWLALASISFCWISAGACS